MYTRRRTVSTHHEEVQCECHSWSCIGLLGALLVQVTCHSTFASFGVMLSFLLGDAGPSWELLTVPIAFVVSWNITEPIMDNLAPQTDVRKLWIAVIAGSVLACQGAFWAAKSPILFDYLIPLIGVVCGCGAGVSKWACSGLVRGYLPPHPWSVRLFDQVCASLAFLLVPILSVFIMDAFGDHGGLLIHCGILMQGVVGGFLLRTSKMQELLEDRRPEIRPFTIRRDAVPRIVISSADESQRSPEKCKRMDSPINQPKCQPKWPRRNAFNLQTKPAVKETLHSLRRPSLPCILEEDEIFGGGSSNRNSVESSPRQYQTLPRPPKRNAFNLQRPLPEVEEGMESSPLKSMTNSEESEESCVAFCSKRNEALSLASLTESTSDEEPAHNNQNELILMPNPDPTIEKNAVEKQRRTFEHVFPPGRLLATLDDNQNDNTNQNTETVHCKSLPKVNSSREEDCGNERSCIISIKSCFSKCWGGCCAGPRECSIIGQVTNNWRDFFSPTVWLCSLLIFSCQNALLTFSTLTPVLIKEYIFDADSGGMDGAYCVSVMGFTWLCFVLASPCFSTIQSSSHQIICIVALSTSSITLYMVSLVNNLDEVVLYSSLFGLSFGVVTLTTHSLLKLNLPTPLLPFLSPRLSILVSLLHFLVLLISAVGQWGDHLKALYILPTCCLALTAALWTIHSCVASVRANRSTRDFTWSRPRRFS